MNGMTRLSTALLALCHDTGPGGGEARSLKPEGGHPDGSGTDAEKHRNQGQGPSVISETKDKSSCSHLG
jgi:hypothetical protein